MATTAFRLQEFGTHNQKVVFFFAGMGTRTWMYKRPIKRMVANGFRVFAYDFDPLLVHRGDAEDYLAVAHTTFDDVSTKLQTLKAAGLTDFSSFGFSMGTILAIKTAAELPEIKRSIIMLTYGSIAENIWTWWFIHPAKRRAIRQGYTMESLDKKLASISPIPNAPRLKGKKILLYIAFRDKILVYKQSHQFQEALDKAGVDYQLIENTHFGHNLSAYNNFRRHANWIKFLNS